MLQVNIMTKLLQKWVVFTALAALVACTTTDSDSNALKRPRYALSDFSGGYIVDCDRLAVTFGTLRDFYNSDGTQKTQRQVCREYNPGSRIRR